MIKSFIKYFALSTLTALALLLSLGAAAGTIYRTVDKNGTVSFSDQPPAPGAKQAATIEVSGSNSYANPIPRAPYEPGETTQAEGPRVAGKDFYQSLDITYPTNDTSLRDNSGTVKIGTRLSPGLRDEDQLILMLNGQRTNFQSDDGEILLTDLPRGTHRISLVVVDEGGAVQLSSGERVFHLKRFAPALAP